MDMQTKLFFGKILGEIYRIQKKFEMPCPASQGQIFGLLNGFENCIEEEFEMIGSISKKQVNIVAEVLDEIYLDKTKLENFKGFYDIENKLSSKGIDRGEANQILSYFYADHRFTEIIEKMDTSNSPTEMRRFTLSEFDK